MSIKHEYLKSAVETQSVINKNDHNNELLCRIATCNYYSKFKYILNAPIEKRAKENEILVNYH